MSVDPQDKGPFALAFKVLRALKLSLSSHEKGKKTTPFLLAESLFLLRLEAQPSPEIPLNLRRYFQFPFVSINVQKESISFEI